MISCAASRGLTSLYSTGVRSIFGENANIYKRVRTVVGHIAPQRSSKSTWSSRHIVSLNPVAASASALVPPQHLDFRDIDFLKVPFFPTLPHVRLNYQFLSLKEQYCAASLILDGKYQKKSELIFMLKKFAEKHPDFASVLPSFTSSIPSPREYEKLATEYYSLYERRMTELKLSEDFYKLFRDYIEFAERAILDSKPIHPVDYENLSDFTTACSNFQKDVPYSPADFDLSKNSKEQVLERLQACKNQLKSYEDDCGSYTNALLSCRSALMEAQRLHSKP